MPETMSLFDEPQLTAEHGLRERLKGLAQEKIYFGTSSWKYEGWLGQIYTASRYKQRGKFSNRLFDAESLSEYADTFHVVCGDFTFYQFPTAAALNRLFSQTRPSFQLTFKVTEEISVLRFPNHPRYGERAGTTNPAFLDADLFKEKFLQVLLPHACRIPFLILEFGAFPSGSFRSPHHFCLGLERFLHAVAGHFRFAVEIRNPELLQSDYFAVLQQAKAAHVFSSWTSMPPLTKQLELSEAWTTDFSVTRALLTPGRDYADAVRKFSPYRVVQEVNEEVRNALRSLLLRAKSRGEPTFIFVNNRLEGNAPQTISAVVGVD